MRYASFSVLFISIAYVVTAQKFDIGGGGGGNGGGGGGNGGGGGGGGGSSQPGSNTSGNRPSRKQKSEKQQNNQNNQNNPPASQDQNGNKDATTSLCLDKSIIQKAALSDGILDKANPDKFAPSLISSNNFINFCVGATVTDGKQNDQGSCNPTPMGSIPSAQKMPAVKIKSPTPSQNIQPKTPFEIQIGVKNLDTGFFSSPKNTYYLAPQQLNTAGEIKGHVHVTIQQLSEQDDTPDTSQFQFFKGISDAAQNGILKTTVTNGLPAGRYRLATITSTINHQVVAVPVANRGTVEDAIYFSVGGAQTGGGGTGNRLTSIDQNATGGGNGNSNGGNGNSNGGNGNLNGGGSKKSHEKGSKKGKQGGGKREPNRQTSNPTSNNTGNSGRILKSACKSKIRRQKRQEFKTKKKIIQTTRRSLPSQIQRPAGLHA